MLIGMWISSWTFFFLRLMMPKFYCYMFLLQIRIIFQASCQFICTYQTEGMFTLCILSIFHWLFSLDMYFWGWKMFLYSLYAYFVEIIGLGSLTMQGNFNYYQEGLLILFNYIKLQQLAVKDIYDVNIRLVAFCCP